MSETIEIIDINEAQIEQWLLELDEALESGNYEIVYDSGNDLAKPVA
jgi:hypothetical protein